MCERDRIFSGYDIGSQALVLLHYAYLVAFLAYDVPMLSLLQINERFMDDMAGCAKIRIVLGVPVITVPIDKKGKDNHRDYKTFKVIRDHGSITNYLALEIFLRRSSE